MKSKMVRKLTALFVAGTMMAAMGTTVMAESQNVIITKKLEKDANAYAPATTFNFEVEPAAGVSGNVDGVAISAGIPGGVTFGEGAGSIVSAPTAGDIGKNSIEVGETELTVNTSAFANATPGIYRYAVKETSGEYEGVGYSDETKYFDVYVNSDHEPYAYMFVSSEDATAKDETPFTNTYNHGENGVNDLTITKTVKGNQVITGDEFAFKIKVDGADGEMYHVVYGNGTTETLNSGEEKTIYLTADQSATIYGLSSGDTYTVTEDAESKQGYEYTTKIDGVSSDTRSTSGTISEDTTIKFENTRNATTPTGIVTDVAPYVIMVAAAVILGFAFLRKRSYK